MKTINYSLLIKQHPWILHKNQNCILSPDADGLLCGLFMSKYLDWNIKGFYDSKVLLKEEGVDTKKCIFLDMEIFRKEIRSVGQHLLLFNKNNHPEDWDNFENCISPNNIRNYDFKNNFQLKYPLGTIHILLSIISQKHKVRFKKDIIPILLYVDGTFKNLFNYPENCLSW